MLPAGPETLGLRTLWELGRGSEVRAVPAGLAVVTRRPALTVRALTTSPVTAVAGLSSAALTRPVAPVRPPVTSTVAALGTAVVAFGTVAPRSPRATALGAPAGRALLNHRVERVLGGQQFE